MDPQCPTGDPRFANNPNVAGGDLNRFYAGAPVVTADGFAAGILCVKYTAPGSCPTHGDVRCLPSPIRWPRSWQLRRLRAQRTARTAQTLRTPTGSGGGRSL